MKSKANNNNGERERPIAWTSGSYKHEVNTLDASFIKTKALVTGYLQS